MMKIKNFLGSELRYSNGGKGKSEKKKESSLATKLSVNEEYKEALRTTSYLEIRTKVEGELGRTICNKPCSSSALSIHIRLTDFLLEPQQESLRTLMEEQSSNFNRLVVKFFESISESCEICETLLKSIHETRVYHRKIRSVIKIGRRVMMNECSHPEKLCQTIFQKLSRFSVLKNPLAVISKERFREVRDSNTILLKRLSSKQRRTRRKAKIYRFCKRIGASGLVISHTAIVISLLIISLHSIIGILAAPVAIGCCSLGLSKTTKIAGKFSKTKMLEVLEAQLDASAKGIFILMNDFDMMSRLAERLYDEIEHRRSIARICVKNGKIEVMKAAVKEFCVNEQSFLDQLQELEEHVYLCLQTIDRSRRLVLELQNVDV